MIQFHQANEMAKHEVANCYSNLRCRLERATADVAQQIEKKNGSFYMLWSFPSLTYMIYYNLCFATYEFVVYAPKKPILLDRYVFHTYDTR